MPRAQSKYATLPDASETEELLNTALALHRDTDTADTDSLDSDDTKLGTPAPCKHCGHSSSSFPTPSKDTGSNDRLLTFALVLALVSLGLSIVSSLYTTAARSRQDGATSPYSSAGTQGKALPRPNAYMGLERVQWPANASEIFKPIQSWPLSIWQMRAKDAKGSRALLPEQDRHHFTKEGTVTPEDHRVVVDSQTSSILQYRALDWGMENCILHFSVPPLPVAPHTHAPGTEGEHEEEEPHSLKDGPDPPAGSLFEQADVYANATIAPGTTIDIFWLGDDTAHEFLPNVYWGTAPKRIGEAVKRIVLTPGLVSGSYPFSCPSGTFPTFELACVSSSDGCKADWWQDADRGPRAGFYIEQQWSKS